LSRLKKLQDTYKDVITPDDIQTIGEQQRRFVNTTERRLIAGALDDLKTYVANSQRMKLDQLKQRQKRAGRKSQERRPLL